MEFRGLLARCSPARVLEEIYRLLGSGQAARTLAARPRDRRAGRALARAELPAAAARDDRARSPAAPLRSRGPEPSLPGELAGDAGPPDPDELAGDAEPSDPEELAGDAEPSDPEELARDAEPEALEGAERRAAREPGGAGRRSTG